MRHRNENSEKVIDIVNDLSILRSHLYSLETKYVSDPTMIDEHRAGCPPKVDERLERRTTREIKFGPYLTSNEIARHVNEQIEDEKQISSDTVQRIAHKFGYYAYRPQTKPPIDEDQKTARAQLARLYRERTMHFRRNTFFIDETFIRLHPKDSVKEFGESKAGEWKRRTSCLL